MTLRADADEADERKGILLITLHAAKGLEFDEVFLAGIEDGSLPHASSRDDDEQFEEERRLAYVGMTRAKERLTLSCVRRRMVRGEWMSREPSPVPRRDPGAVLEREDLTYGGGSDVGARRILRREEGRAPAARPVGFGGPAASLFPDYENESQETPAPRLFPSKKPLFAFPGAQPSPVRPVMKRTPPPPTASGFRRGSKVRPPGVRPGRRPDDRGLRRRREADRLLRPRGPQEVRRPLREPLAGLSAQAQGGSSRAPRPPAAASGARRRGGRSPTRGGRPWPG